MSGETRKAEGCARETETHQPQPVAQDAEIGLGPASDASGNEQGEKDAQSGTIWSKVIAAEVRDDRRKNRQARDSAVTVIERKNVEDAEDDLRASETRYRRLFESARDGILILDADTGQVVDVNPFLVSLLGYSHADFLGKNVWDLGPVQRRRCLKGRLQGAAREGIYPLRGPAA